MDAAGLGMTAVFAAALVPIVSLLKNKDADSRYNYVLSMLASMLAAVLGGIVGDFGDTWNERLVSLATAIGTSQTVYMLFFRDTKLNDKLSEM